MPDPIINNLPIGLSATGQRAERDSMGSVDVPADRYWGAQTQRSLHHFSIGRDKMPVEVYRAYGTVKKAAAEVNAAMGRLPAWKAAAIVRAADETISGALDEHYPLFVWQTGSGTQSNMNVNEVIANRAIQLLGGTLGENAPVHPNDDVNMSQSSNDTFPTAMHVATVTALDARLLPELDALAGVIEQRSAQWMDVVKIGRTHLEDAVPLTVGQEWSGWAPPDPRRHRRRAAGAHRAAGTGGGRHGGRDRHHRAEGVRGCDCRADRRVDRAAVRDGREQVRGPGLARRDGAGQRVAARCRGRADEGRQRHAVARLGAALRARRVVAAR